MMDADFFRAWITAIADIVDEQRDRLTQLDAAIGDADHGTNLARGFGAVREALAKTQTRTPGAVLRLTGTTLISTVGGASGPLYGTAFRRAAKSFGDAREVGLPALAEALTAALEGVTKLGAAGEGDKTMVDALAPAVAAFGKAVADGPGTAGPDPAAALGALADAAEAGARATVEMQAAKGRASYLGPRSVGHEDPGAASTALMLRALRDVATRPRQAP
ncbi:MAG TPA: dihydroxyacetone kinase subunit DhaL [Trebonia sp.]|jgi:dihydroxyacetone kinase-like protein|nr:dihydroxyacetone kinase subunit DhaL [Trebonia sp.]